MPDSATPRSRENESWTWWNCGSEFASRKLALTPAACSSVPARAGKSGPERVPLFELRLLRMEYLFPLVRCSVGMSWISGDPSSPLPVGLMGHHLRAMDRFRRSAVSVAGPMVTP